MKMTRKIDGFNVSFESNVEGVTRKERLRHIVNRYFFRGDGWDGERKPDVIRMWEVRDDSDAVLIFDVLSEECDREGNSE